MKKFFFFLFVVFLFPPQFFGEIFSLEEKGWGELGKRKNFPSKDFFESGSRVNGNLLPNPVQYVDQASMTDPKNFIEYTANNFVPKMRDFSLPGLVVSAKKVASCVFIGGPKGEEIYFMKEGAVCRVKDRWLNMDIVYNVIRKAKKISLSKKYIYYYIATVRLKNFVGKNGKYATVNILNSVVEIEDGDILVPYESMKSVINVIDKKPGVASKPSKIVSFSKEYLDVSGSEDYVFLPHGKEYGFVKGRIYAVHRTNSWEKKFSSPSRYVVNDLLLVGKVLIVDVSEAGAIGYVLDSKGELYLEDIVGGKWDVGFY